MADLIERSRAISAVNWHGQRCDCIEEIRNIPAVNQWIPCSERLPEQGQRVIVQFRYSNNTGTVISTAQRTYSGSWIVDAMQYADKERITIQAWMPQPDAYEPPDIESDTEKESD